MKKKENEKDLLVKEIWLYLVVGARYVVSSKTDYVVSSPQVCSWKLKFRSSRRDSGCKSEREQEQARAHKDKLKSVSFITTYLDSVSISPKLKPFPVEVSMHQTQKLERPREDFGEGGRVTSFLTTSCWWDKPADIQLLQQRGGSSSITQCIL